MVTWCFPAIKSKSVIDKKFSVIMALLVISISSIKILILLTSICFREKRDTAIIISSLFTIAPGNGFNTNKSIKDYKHLIKN